MIRYTYTYKYIDKTFQKYDGILFGEKPDDSSATFYISQDFVH